MNAESKKAENYFASTKARRVELSTYRYILLVATLIMSIIFATQSVDVPPINYVASFSTANYVLSPLVLGWIGSFLFFRFSKEQTIKDDKSLLLGFLLALSVLFACYFSTYNWSKYLNLNYLYGIIGVVILIIAIILIMQIIRFSDIMRVTDEDTWINFVIQFITYIPCLIEDAIIYIMNKFKITTPPIIVFFIIELLLLVLIFTLPTIMNSIIQQNKGLILPGASSLADKMIISDSSIMIHEFVDESTSNQPLINSSLKTTYNQNYAFSMWIYINKYDNGIHRQQRNIFNYGNESLNGKPCIYIQSSQVYISLSNTMPENSTIPLDIHAQKWNQIVVNYRYNQVDVFVNGELNKTIHLESNFPTMSPDDVVVIGDDRGGISGSICNISYHSKPLNKMDISSMYSFLHLFNPPVIPGTSSSSAAAQLINKQTNGFSLWNQIKYKYSQLFPVFVSSVSAPQQLSLMNSIKFNDTPTTGASLVESDVGGVTTTTPPPTVIPFTQPPFSGYHFT